MNYKMDRNNVYTSAKVISKDDEVQEYQLGRFAEGEQSVQFSENNSNLNHEQENDGADSILNEVKTLSAQIEQVNGKLTLLENNEMTLKQIDAQVVQAIKDLKHYSSFFEQAIFQMESKLLKTSISIAQKIISIELGENSTQIARQTIKHLLDKIKNASKIKIHLNPKDYMVLKSDMNVKNFIELVEDSNVTVGGVVMASDLGNFDGNIEAKVSTMLESLDSVI